MISKISNLFIWWNGQTIGTKIYTKLFGNFVGTDENGNPMTEVIAGGNAKTVSGNQYFKTVTSISSDGLATADIQIGTAGTEEPLLTATAKTFAHLYSINKTDENYSLSILSLIHI